MPAPPTGKVSQPVPRDSIVVTATPPPSVNCDLSLIIPAYNEERRLPPTLEHVVDFLKSCDFSYELLVVDDGSRDGTRQLVRDFAVKHNFVRLVQYDSAGHPVNRGKGFAVRQGVLNSVGANVLFSDADLSTPIEELHKLIGAIQKGECDVAIASRALPGSILAVHQPWYREAMGRCFNKVVQLVAVPGVKDTQCGFKAFRGDVAKRIFTVARIDGFGFDPEILYLARKFGQRIAEIPVTWEHRDESRVSPLSAPLQMMRELLTIRLNDARGCYTPKSATTQ